MAPAPEVSVVDLAALFESALVLASLGNLPSGAPTTQASLQSGQIEALDGRLTYERLTAIFCGRRPDLALQWLLDVGLLAHLLPELVATAALADEGQGRHKDVWEHTKIVVRQAVARPALRWAAVLHDIGKVTTRHFVSSSKVTFIGHAEAGATMFREGPARRMAFPAEIAERVERLIFHHLRPAQYDASWSDAAVRRFVRDMGPDLVDVLDLSRADVTSQRPGQRRQCLRRISELGRRVRRIKAELKADRERPALPSGLGDALMAEFSLSPGRAIGELKRRLALRVESGDLVVDSDLDLSAGGRGAPSIEACLREVRRLSMLDNLELDSRGT